MLGCSIALMKEEVLNRHRAQKAILRQKSNGTKNPTELMPVEHSEVLTGSQQDYDDNRRVDGSLA